MCIRDRVKVAFEQQLEVARTHLNWLSRQRETRIDRGSASVNGGDRTGTHRNGKPERPRDPREEEVRDARRFLTGLNYDGLAKSRKTEFGGKILTLAELSDEQIIKEAERLSGAMGQIKADKKKTSGSGQKGGKGGKR